MSFRWSRRRHHERCARHDATAALSAAAAASVLTGVLMVGGMAACTITRIPSTPAPAPQPATPAPSRAPAPVPLAPAAPRGGGPWQFAPAAGTYSYVIVTDGQVQRTDSAAPPRTLPTTTQRVTLGIFSTGDVQLVDPAPPASGTPCDAAAALATRARELIPRIPASLSAGATWTDSSTVDGCRGSIPATTHTASHYTVIGDTTIGGVAALQLHRADTLSAKGEGTQGQHRITLSATGTAAADIYVDPASGRFLATDDTQETSVEVGTSGRVQRFLQHVHERATLAPASPSPTP